MMNDQEKSDSPIVAVKPMNKPGRTGAESAEPRGGAKGNTNERCTTRTPSRTRVLQGLERVRERAKAHRKERFTALLHHVDVDLLNRAYFWLKKEAAPGIDGMTWEEYGKELEVRLNDLHSRVHRGAYRAQPSRRQFIPKPDGKQRPIYEADFKGFSYGFRPKRGQHQALDALATGIIRTPVNWIIDADIRAFFDSVNHDWLMRFMEHRVGDVRLLRLSTAKGNLIIVRYADDTVVGFQHLADATRFLAELRERLESFSLSLHSDKTRCVVRGFNQYHGLPTNCGSLQVFRQSVIKAWLWTLRRRSQRQRTTWNRMVGIADRWLPLPGSSIRGPNAASPPNTQGGSPVRESRPPGSERGALGNQRPYRNLNKGMGWKFRSWHPADISDVASECSCPYLTINVLHKIIVRPLAKSPHHEH
jgi:RNA-directed DNA polymerase